MVTEASTITQRIKFRTVVLEYSLKIPAYLLKNKQKNVNNIL